MKAFPKKVLKGCADINSKCVHESFCRGICGKKSEGIFSGSAGRKRLDIFEENYAVIARFTLNMLRSFLDKVESFLKNKPSGIF